MYKIYINDTPLLLILQPESGLPPAGEDDLVARYPGKSKFLLHYVNMLENTRRWDQIRLFSPDPAGMWSDFQKHFDREETAGLVITNDSGTMLFRVDDSRRSLPVSEIAPGCTAEETAREIARDLTGIDDWPASSELPATYRTLRREKRRILQRTHWYRMTPERELPDLDPESFEWVTADAIRQMPSSIPAHIRSILT
ncbi:NUDIX hydrolase [Flavilitoribacter nigricans]|uniref:NUDIX hydrolase n=1 Tax=Flavilitoribacter nigricans (strain ATCC 23147 / DSM 23189 / NBRC 102662 / NCIMB 1420 / SS-2) TaxID=1122177 RepID=A0A2D0N9P8_FLAN2|nr:hypothetical protein [Flavilitoribacter nigricans]PHN05242.1 hypothetical protein CRP01_17135 [Flavilitoribacter nigricans DSM 23189 = NBRC 102662]